MTTHSIALLTVTRRGGDRSTTVRLLSTPNGLVVEQDGVGRASGAKTAHQALHRHQVLRIARLGEATRFVRDDPEALSIHDVVAAIRPTSDLPQLHPDDDDADVDDLGDHLDWTYYWAERHRISVDDVPVVAVLLPDGSLAAITIASGRYPTDHWGLLVGGGSDSFQYAGVGNAGSGGYYLYRPRPGLLAEVQVDDGEHRIAV